MALSSDGTMLAIATGTEPAVAGLRVYSTATGLLLHAWSASSAELRGIEVVSPVSWTSGGHQLIFQTSASTTGPVVVRLLQADDPGHDMLADSRPVFTFMTRVGSPDNCIDGFAMAGNGRTVLCGSAAQVHEPASFGNKECPTYTHPVSTAIRQASAVTGKLTGTLYQAAVSCQTPGNLALFWVNDDGTAVLGNLLHSQAGPSGSTWKPIEQFGLFTRGKFTPLPAPLETSLGLPSITAW
jgi:hypothetical protein